MTRLKSHSKYVAGLRLKVLSGTKRVLDPDATSSPIFWWFHFQRPEEGHPEARGHLLLQYLGSRLCLSQVLSSGIFSVYTLGPMVGICIECARATKTNCHRMGSLGNRDLFSHNSGN